MVLRIIYVSVVPYSFVINDPDRLNNKTSTTNWVYLKAGLLVICFLVPLGNRRVQCPTLAIKKSGRPNLTKLFANIV